MRTNRTYHYKHEKLKGSIYEGEWLGGFRDGQGKMTWSDGAYYEGNWKDNHAHGKGKFVHSIGDIYEGEWIRDKACGLGTYKSQSTGG